MLMKESISRLHLDDNWLHIENRGYLLEHVALLLLSFLCISAGYKRLDDILR